MKILGIIPLASPAPYIPPACGRIFPNRPAKAFGRCSRVRTRFTIPATHHSAAGSYVVRLPYDLSNKDYTIGERNREFGDSMKKDFQDLGESFKELGEVLKNPASQ